MDDASRDGNGTPSGTSACKSPISLFVTNRRDEKVLVWTRVILINDPYTCLLTIDFTSVQHVNLVANQYSIFIHTG